MSDDLDDLLRRTMKTLDDQVPSGYFDALPERVSARLAGDEGTMQHGTSGTTNQAPSAAPPVAAPVATRDEDSGLHDIRNLAQSTKQRLSSKRITTSPPAHEDDVLATSSASWRNVALPQPANMVSLPAIEDLPSKQEIKAQEKAAKKAAKLEAKLETQAPAAPAPVAAIEPSASSATEFKPAFSSFAERARPSHRGRNIALAGMGLAAAAGIGIFVMTQKNSASDKAAPVAARSESNTVSLADKTKALDEATAKLQARGVAQEAQEAKDQGAAVTGAAGAAAPAPPAVEEDVKATPAPAKAAKHGATKGKAEPKVKAEDTATKVETPAKPEGKGDKKKAEPGDPSFDELLKEAGVDQKKQDKPKLDKKQLSGEDFKKGMAAVQAKAASCYKGTQGTASVKLTVAPSGQVSKVTVSGVFAGKPEADCVASAVKSAQFPAWDGGPQSFGYPILLSE